MANHSMQFLKQTHGVKYKELNNYKKIYLMRNKKKNLNSKRESKKIIENYLIQMMLKN